MKKTLVFMIIAMMFAACVENGKTGLTALTSFVEEEAGENCENGGTKVETGLDESGDGVLDEDEVQDTKYICNGESGTDGADGTAGEKGDQGEPGLDGSDSKDGTDGSDGENGSDGANGTDGEDGSDGSNGEQGNPGDPGADGSDGVCAGNHAPGIDLIKVDDVIFSGSDISVEKEASHLIEVSATDEDGDPLTYSVIGGYSDMTDNGDGNYSAVFHYLGRFDYSVVVSDGCQVTIENFTVSVSPAGMVSISAGSFWMGSPADELGRDSNETLHYVELTKGFYMDSTEVTQGDFNERMGYNPSNFSSCGNDCPVERVSWNEALAYANEMSKRAGAQECFNCTGIAPDFECTLKAKFSKPQDCRGYRLPTESEWEYAVRAGTDTAFYNGEITIQGNDPNMNEIGWFGFNSDTGSGTMTHLVGNKVANSYGLYDMNGNVWEWTMDFYDYNYPSGTEENPAVDPVGSLIGTKPVYRGGSWKNGAYYCRNASRMNFTPSYRVDELGFRLVRTEKDLVDGQDGEDGDQGEDGEDGVCAGNHVPVIDSIIINNGDPVAVYVAVPLIITAHDDDTGDTLSYVVSGSGASITDNGNGSYEITVEQEGKCNFAVIVSDGCQVITGQFAVEVSMVLIPAGTFEMGSPTDELGRYSDETLHTVTLTKNFYMNKYEVTQGEFNSAMGYNPSSFSSCDNCPVEGVSWHEALAYANERSKFDSLEECFDCTGSGTSITCSLKAIFAKPQDCKGYRLPTEAEWEYAARANTTTAFYNGDITNTGSDPNMNEIGWYFESIFGNTHPVGGKLANSFGLYDMSGNVWEWNMDWSGDYPVGPVTDPVGAESGSDRVGRGGSWFYAASFCRSAYRFRYTPTGSNSDLGFRLSRTE